MKYRYLGTSGLVVSELCFGAMSFGSEGSWKSVGALEQSAAQRVVDIIEKLHSEGVGIIHITHNMAEAALAQRVVVMREGRIVLDGRPTEVFARADLLKHMGLQLPQITELLLEMKEEIENYSGRLRQAADLHPDLKISNKNRNYYLATHLAADQSRRGIRPP